MINLKNMNNYEIKQTNSPYCVILTGGEGIIEEKKSKFIARVESVESEQAALGLLEEEKKKYWDAKHHCSAWILAGSDGNLPVMRCSDDGEPSGTAGKPMLEVLKGNGLMNTAVVVTRYFGGTLLGTGGLIRAYTQAVQKGLEFCKTGWMRYGERMRLTTDYNGIGKVLYQLQAHALTPESADYGAEVILTVLVLEEEKQRLEKALMECTNGQIGIDVLERGYFVFRETKPEV